MTTYIVYSVLAVFIYMNLLFVIALIRKDNYIADIAWGIGFILVAALTFFLERGSTPRQILANALVLIWGLRLAAHIFIRNRKRGEDFRYAQWRKNWGKWFLIRSYLQVFILQGILLLVICYQVMLINHSDEGGLTPLDFLGTVGWLAGFLFEAIGDYQLLKFKSKKENKGKVMTLGLWKYTRHPNYFGEATIWWGIFLIALSVKSGWIAILSPVVITTLLLRVSGVTLLEKKYEGNPEYAEYIRKTNVFIPWFPKK